MTNQYSSKDTKKSKTAQHQNRFQTTRYQRKEKKELYYRERMNETPFTKNANNFIKAKKIEGESCQIILLF